MGETYGRTDMHSCGCIEDADGYVIEFCDLHRPLDLPEDSDGPDPWVVGEGELSASLFGEDPKPGPPYVHVLKPPEPVGYDDDGRPFYPPDPPPYTLTTEAGEGTDR